MTPRNSFKKLCFFQWYVIIEHFTVYSKIKDCRVKAIAHDESEIFACVFSYSPSFPIKMHATDAKTQKIKPDKNFFWRTKVSEAVCKRDWHNVMSYLFFNVRKFRTQCAETLSLLFQLCFSAFLSHGYRTRGLWKRLLKKSPCSTRTTGERL